jgi:hypothetical protein
MVFYNIYHSRTICVLFPEVKDVFRHTSSPVNPLHIQKAQKDVTVL